MVLLTVVIGGVTRLTESGLSITEWRPISGIVPPLTEAAWQAEFTKYQEIPQFRVDHPDMTLAGFKQIYFWEFVHRLWARLVGVGLGVPLVIGLARRWFSRRLVGRLVGVLVLTGLQGALGWYLVKSGLTGRTSVSQYRLAAHLGLALAIFCLTAWTAADLLAPPRVFAGRGFRRHAMATTALVFLTALAGALVAGTKAGKVYNEFPLMGGRIVPDGYLFLRPWWRNVFDNAAAVQFDHRALATVVLLTAGALGLRLLSAVAALRTLGALVILAVVAQFGLGLVTLLWSVPIPAAALHQAGAVLLLGVCLLTVHRVSGGAPPANEPADPVPAGVP